MIQNKLYNLADLEYLEFSKKLLPEYVPMIGVRLPVLRKLSKEVSLEELTDETFEEVMLQGMVIGHIRDFSLFQKECLKFLPKIDNWSVCDSFVVGLKITKKYPNEMLSFLKTLTCASHEYTRRFVLVMLIHDYLKEEYLEEVCLILKQIKKDGYFVGMACAWLLAELYSKDREQVLVILSSKEYNLNRFIFKKTISKIRDSYKVSREEKEEIVRYIALYESIWEESIL